ncbi:hypothetical protein K469DRAFT_4450 [Zopfia rhizophila CBS 207.26]|uniref:Uncharacterized protein n=1 Tax=Zopfia rhizophila CBS 207.26 TaxID=1314779 RepID=A0A6A6EYD3_9PEZI|nr:hypothetical protein K469DRAFT_4450 [Zopfia rhizophila CBS 207.26]
MHSPSRNSSSVNSVQHHNGRRLLTHLMPGFGKPEWDRKVFDEGIAGKWKEACLDWWAAKLCRDEPFASLSEEVFNMITDAVYDFPISLKRVLKIRGGVLILRWRSTWRIILSVFLNIEGMGEGIDGE